MKNHMAYTEMIMRTGDMIPTRGVSPGKKLGARAFLEMIIAIAALIVSGVCLAQGQDVVGDWEGILNAGTAKSHVILHIAKDSGGNLQATMDNVDQGAFGLPVGSMSLKDSKLKFDVDKVQGSYVGKLNPDATKISGEWAQSGASLDLDFKRATSPVKAQPNPAPPSDIDGAWLGTVEAGGTRLRVVFHILNTADGLTATMDSPDQGVNGVPATAVTRNGSSLKIEMKQKGAAYEGKISSDLSTIEGTYTWPAGSLPVAVKRVKDVSDLERRPRPQDPVKPYPYGEHEVSYNNNKAQGVTLAGTLTVPPGKGPFPAVLLIPGSGPHDRDETLLGHKLFLVLADYLTRKGIVVLRVDDRGVGKSTGSRTDATTADFATDAEAGVAYLKTRPEVDPHKIGLIGHSEGGLIAPMVAASDPDIAFIVMMAGPGVPGDEILVEQRVMISEASGMSHEAAEQNVALERELLTLVKQEKDNAVLEKELRDKLVGVGSEVEINVQIKAITSPWMRYFITYDPATALRKVKCPVLAINGEKDLQVSPKQNLPVIRKALEDGGNQHFEVDELSGLNHLFQPAKTGAPSEYGEIEQTMSPVAMEKIANWILMDPKPVGVFHVLDPAYSALSDYDRAIQDYSEVIRQNPTSADAFIGRGSTYLAAGEYDRAIQDYNEAIRLNPRSAGAFTGRGSAYLHKGAYERAIPDFNAAISLNPKSAGAFALRGSAYLDRGDYDLAIQDYDQAILLDSKSAETFNGRGAAYFGKEDYGHAIQDYTEAIHLNPDAAMARALLNRGLAHLYAGQSTEAQQDLSQNLRLHQTDLYSVIWLYLSRAKGGTDGKEELKTNTAGLNLSKWPGPVIQLYLGQTTPEDALRAAGSDSDQTCEYSFYVGEYRALRGERPEALALFRSARDGCPKDFIEYVPTLIELQHLEKQK
jgi:lipoprotein NlpI/pimeloyl-ACP methyl ester carboxylesterase